MLTTSEEERNRKYSDITLVATMSSKLNNSDSSSMPSINFYAHNIIVTVHSPALARMFEHDMEVSEVIII